MAAGKVIFWADSWLVTVPLAKLYAHNNKAPAATSTTVNKRPPTLTMASNDFLRVLGSFLSGLFRLLVDDAPGAGRLRRAERPTVGRTFQGLGRAYKARPANGARLRAPENFYYGPHKFQLGAARRATVEYATISAGTSMRDRYVWSLGHGPSGPQQLHSKPRPTHRACCAPRQY